MPRIIAQRDLRNQNARVIEAVAAGQSFVVTRNGTPVAELRPVTTTRSPFVSKAELLALSVHSPHIDAAAFRRDLDSIVDQGVGG